MAKNEVHVLMSAAHAQVVQAWLQANRGPQEMLNLLKQLGTAGQQAGKRGSDGLDKMATSAMGFGKALLGIGSAFQAASTAAAAVRAELDAIKRAREEQGLEQVDVGRQVERLRMFLPRTSDMTAEQIVEQVTTRAGGLRVPEMINEVISSISSDLGSKISERVDRTLLTAQAFRGGSTEERAAINAALADLVRVFGGSVQQQLGTIAETLTASRSTDIDMFSRNIVGAITDLAAFGFTQEDATKLVLGFQQRALDPEGATTRTNVLKVARQAQEIAQAQGKFNIRGMDLIRNVQEDVSANKFVLNAFRQGLLAESDQPLDDDFINQAKTGNLKKDSAKFRSGLRQRERTFVAAAELLAPPGTATQQFQTKALVDAAADEIAFGAEAVQRLNQKLEENRTSQESMVFQLSLQNQQLRNELLRDRAAGIRAETEQLIEGLPTLFGETAMMRRGLLAASQAIPTGDVETEFMRRRRLLEDVRGRIGGAQRGGFFRDALETATRAIPLGEVQRFYLKQLFESRPLSQQEQERVAAIDRLIAAIDENTAAIRGGGGVAIVPPSNPAARSPASGVGR